ncbi:MAG: hypothetical protein JO115_14135 [Pseudonocardiales bacterium]|nr:hypothetical protein [Pseudonocardiales bacterium]
MSEALSFAEIDGQHLELLPARTVMSMFVVKGGGDGGKGGSGGKGAGGLIGANVLNIAVLGDQLNSAADGKGGEGGSANGGRG